MASPRISAIQSPSEREWESHRPELEKLYSIDDKPLHEVMSYMKNKHAFIAKYATFIALTRIGQSNR